MLATDLVPAAMVAAAVAPALLVLWLIVAADSRPEPPKVVLIGVILGALSTAAAAVLELLLQQVLPFSSNRWVAAYETALWVASIPEETLKVGIIAAIALHSREFDEPMDGIVYGSAVGLGFAALENLLYVIGAGAGWGTIAAVRGVLSVPFHGALGAIAGSYIVRARFTGVLGAHKDDHWRRRRLFVLAWFVPVVLHSIFDAALFAARGTPAEEADKTEGMVGILLTLSVAAVVGFGAIIFAAVLARRIARRQKMWLETKRLPPVHWRDVWAECLIGIGLSFIALMLVIAGGPAMKLAGCGLMVLALGTAWHCGKSLNEAAKARHPAVAAASAAS